ncbi:MAG TPA: hypothetical protein P5248_08565, partial [Bacteroidales bacterium]|nr:hypothetical protein [Bacteroidales bacterium]
KLDPGSLMSYGGVEGKIVSESGKARDGFGTPFYRCMMSDGRSLNLCMRDFDFPGKSPKMWSPDPFNRQAAPQDDAWGIRALFRKIASLFTNNV